MALLRLATWVLATALRIEMRLLSETRNVLEYLASLSVNMRKYAGDRGDNLTIFREWPFFIGGSPQPDSKIMRPNKDLMKSGLLRARVPVSVLYLNYVNYRDGRNMWVTHGKYDEHQERDNSN
jgi:hypothetical protein